MNKKTDKKKISKNIPKYKDVPWLEIKTEFMKQIPPRDLAIKYKIPAQVISRKATKEKWVEERARMSENVRESIEQNIKDGAEESITYLRSVVKDENIEPKDRISAAKGLLDVSGLKSSKTELTGKDGAPLAVQKEYILPEEIKEFEEHYKKSMGE